MVQVVKFNNNNSDSRYFTKAQHGAEVVITGVEKLETRSGSEYLCFTFEDDEGREGNTGYNNYITPKAFPYTAGRIQGIAVHNCRTDMDKKKMTASIAEMEDDAFVETFTAALVGKKAYLVVGESDNINPKNNRPYLEFNLQGYAPRPLETVDTAVAKAVTGGEELTKDNLNDLPF